MRVSRKFAGWWSGVFLALPLGVLPGCADVEGGGNVAYDGTGAAQQNSKQDVDSDDDGLRDSEDTCVDDADIDDIGGRVDVCERRITDPQGSGQDRPRPVEVNLPDWDEIPTMPTHDGGGGGGVVDDGPGQVQ